MRRFIISIFSIFLSLGLAAQAEDYSKKMLDLKWGSSKLDAYMAFEPYRTFHLAGQHIKDWGIFYSEDSTNSARIESIVLVNESQSVYIHLMYANDRLYAKNINWYYDAHEVEEVQGKYKLLNGAATGDVWLVHVSHGRVTGEERNVQSGKQTTYYPPARQNEIFSIQTGYQAISPAEGSGNPVGGFYAYGRLVNTQSSHLNDGILFPIPEILNMPINDIDAYYRQM